MSVCFAVLEANADARDGKRLEIAGRIRFSRSSARQDQFRSKFMTWLI